MIEVRNLFKRYGRHYALRNVSFTLERGKVLGLIGPNGSGKTTLLKILIGITKPTRGYVRINGFEPGPYSRRFIAYVPEVDHLYSWMRVRETFKFYSSFYDDYDEEKARKALELLKLDENWKIQHMSRGQRVRLRIALALSRNAPVLILDEPLSGIDPLSRELILDALIESYDYANQAVIFSTHLVREAERIFDSIVFLHNGEVIYCGDAEELRRKEGMSVEEFFKKMEAEL